MANKSTDNVEFLPKEEENVTLDEQDLKHIEMCPLNKQGNSNVIFREEILDFGDEGFLLKNLMTRDECQFYMEQGEKAGFEKMPGVKKEYRNNLRIMVKNQGMAELLFDRIKPYLKNIVIDGDPHDIHIHGVKSLLQGEWRPLRLNHTFRFCKYHPGGHFAPHFDGHFVENSHQRSFQTLMLYLNNEFNGGSTNFVNERQTLYQNQEGLYCAEEKNILCRLQPVPGMGIIFNHHRLHEGDGVRDGCKYILRTDIIYERVGECEMDPKEEEALQLAQEAERLEARGENLKAMEYYRKAFKMSPSVAQAYGN